MARFTLKSIEKLAHLLGKAFRTVVFFNLILNKIMSERFRLNTDVTAEGFKCTIVNQFSKLINCFRMMMCLFWLKQFYK